MTGVLGRLPDLLRAAEADALTALERARAGEAPLVPHTHAVPGRLVSGDNLRALAQLVVEAEAGERRPALVYLDPPFDSKADYRSRVTTSLTDGEAVSLEHLAYSDRWGGGTPNYLRMLAARLVLVRELLAADGAVCVHVDWHASHWVRVVLDEVFGADNFVNALVWSYRSGGASRTRSVPRKHDDLLLYRRSDAFRIHPLTERQYLERPFIGSKIDDEGRHYVDTLLRDVLEGAFNLVSEGGVHPVSVRPVLNVSAERTGYATQKPLGLLEVLLRWTTDGSDLVIDAFGGSGTTALAAAGLGRAWVSVDSNPQAVATTQARLDGAGHAYLVGRESWGDASIRANFAGATVRLEAFEGTALGAFRAARNGPTDAVARVGADGLAGVGGWALRYRDLRLASAWRDARGRLTTELAVPDGVEPADITLEVTDLAGVTTVATPSA
ncbi:DNA methyltransferase [Gulosibacter sediminis]|uniref:DNA methyltransferase n=1 Tax=Gulosibacter sediminis TaxID=1729695 RepID=UPI0024A9AD14|nr:site-specific DNA-methyltransferase [Gulosibacter sediminis]